MRAVTDLAESDERIVLLTGDLGFMALEPFSQKFPDRFFNVGVAEQNMVGLATGLAEAGFIPFVYSIAPFAVLRPYEFIRNGPILHHLPVRVVGIGAGFDYGHNGTSHYGLEDAGVLRIQPGMSVISPADAEQTRAAVLATWNRPEPVYYRLSKDGRALIPGLEGAFDLGRAQVVREGKDVLFISMGSIGVEVAAAAEALASEGIQATCVIVASLSPPPIEDLVQVLSRFSQVITVEAHYLTGGLGSLISEVVAENGLGCRVIRRGVRTSPAGVTGSQEFLNRLHGLSREQLADAGRRIARENRR